jgi:hypothetical protein
MYAFSFSFIHLYVYSFMCLFPSFLLAFCGNVKIRQWNARQEVRTVGLTTPNLCTSFKLTTGKTHRTQDYINTTHNGKHNIHDRSFLLKL